MLTGESQEKSSKSLFRSKGSVRTTRNKGMGSESNATLTPLSGIHSLYTLAEGALRASVALRRHGKLEVFHNSKSCSICLEPYKNGEKVARSRNPRCEHMFHLDCVVDWLKCRDECPLCRETFADFRIETS